MSVKNSGILFPLESLDAYLYDLSGKLVKKNDGIE